MTKFSLGLLVTFILLLEPSQVLAAEFLLTCDPSDLTFNSNGTARCTDWVLREYSLPLYELTATEISLISTAMLVFLTSCFMGKTIYRFVKGANGET